jgi:hypothetical protein
MTIAEAIETFSETSRQKSTVASNHSPANNRTLVLVARYFSAEADLKEITPSRVRDFVARWYVEEASALKTGSEAGDVEDPAAKDNKRTMCSHQTLNLPSPVEFLNELAALFKWMDVQMGGGEAAGCLAILTELSETLPRAIEINHSLTKASFQECRSAFNFPEFLTSFEEGGSSQYDIDAPGNIGAIDGFFRIIRVEGFLVEAQEVISDELVWPIVFPADVAPMLNDAYVINLELVRARESWQIAGCGFTYPPGTEF